MAEHAGQDRKSAEPAAAPARKAKPSSTPYSELLNRRSEAALGPTIQLLHRRAAIAAATAPQPAQPAARPNRTGLPDRLKAGVEALSGLSMDDVRVQRNSAEPAKLGALAYARGSDIHLSPGQERHLPHEAWHVVQQMQGRVRATRQLKTGLGVNDDARLEAEADRKGAEALGAGVRDLGSLREASPAAVVQRAPITNQQAQEALAERAPAFVGSDIVQPWDTEWDSNCHGYTITGVPTAAIEGDDLLANVGDNAVMVFVRNGVIAHSGRVVGGGQMQHLLIGVGVVRTAVGGPMGYDQRFILPGERHQLDLYLAPHVQAQQREAEIARMVKTAYRAADFEGGQALQDRVFALQDGEADFDEVAAEFALFAEQHPEILQAPEEENEGADEW